MIIKYWKLFSSVTNKTKKKPPRRKSGLVITKRNSIINRMSKEIEKIIKKVRDDANKDTKRHIDVLFEEFDHRMKAMGEWHEETTKQYKEIKKILDSHTEQIGGVLMDLVEVKRDIKDIRYDVAVKLDNKLDKKHFVDLEQRVRRIEKI